MSIYAVPTDAAAAEWAANAVEYAESRNARWDDRESVVDFYAGFAVRQCQNLSMKPPDRTETTTSVEPLVVRIRGRYASPAQVEATMREELGIEGWELVGEVWYDSLVNGLCVRR